MDETIYNETDYFDAVKAARQAGTWKAPSHGLATTYRYNSLNKVVSQQSPDGGKSEFWYDRLGRLAISQNAKQKMANHYSYTTYDVLGRPVEVGQKQQGTAMTQTISRNETGFSSWLNNGTGFDQVTRTVYDKIATLPVISGSTAATFSQQAYTLRNRVSHTLFYNTLNVNTGGVPLYDEYTTGNYYSYDIHGNVATLLNDYRVGKMQEHGINRFKLMDYKYDLISGKVNQVHYQPGERDELYHRYEYDAENRITDVFTTFKKEFVGHRNLEDHEAFYGYYKHGPLAKSIIGQQQVQGIDYAYTLQGWLKAVNPDGTLDNNIIARDAYNFSLHYYSGDYGAISTQTPNLVNASGNVEFKPLYNGNIGAMAVNIKKLNAPLVYNYGYDQLNRLVSMDAFNGWNPAGNIFAPNKLQDYKERVSYDGNGNIISYLRNGSSLNGTPLQMDDMQYGYNKVSGRLVNNKLRHVKDAIDNANYVEDIDNQPDDNYDYDAIGNLISDVKEGITNITWTVYGKIENITKANGTTIAYTYDAAGNRISKTVANSPLGDGATWYVRDASGNAMGLYTTTGTTLNLSEHNLYGSNRLGIWNRSTNMDVVLPTPNIGIGIGTINATLFDGGNKVFELSNQTGNILLTVSDKKVGVDNNSDGVIDYYEPEIITANDMYSGGMMMPGRRFTAPNNSGYRYSINGQEKEKEINENITSAEFWMYDSRIVRRWNVDPRPNYSISPYNVFAGNPIWFSDPFGDTTINGQKYEGTNERSASTLQEVVVRGHRKILPDVKNENSTTIPYAEINSIALDRNSSNYEKIKKLRIIGSRPLESMVQRKLDGALLKNILSGAILQTLDKTFTAIDIVSFGMSRDKGSNVPLEIPVIGVVTQSIVNDLVSEIDQELLEDAAKRGYMRFARTMNSSAGRRSGLLGVYVTKDVMLSVLQTGGLNLSIHKVSKVSGEYPDNPNMYGQFDYFIFYQKKSEGIIKSFGVLPIGK